MTARCSAICLVSNILRADGPPSTWLLTPSVSCILTPCPAPLRLSAKGTGSLGASTHCLHPLADDLVDLEELCATSVDTHSLALEQFSFDVSVRRGVWLDTLCVTRCDESVAISSECQLPNFTIDSSPRSSLQEYVKSPSSSTHKTSVIISISAMAISILAGSTALGSAPARKHQYPSRMGGSFPTH